MVFLVRCIVRYVLDVTLVWGSKQDSGITNCGRWRVGRGGGERCDDLGNFGLFGFS